MEIRELMTSDVATCTPDMPLQEIASMMVEYDCGMIPVVAGDGTTRAIGTITDRDITCRTVARGDNPLNMSAGDIMTGNPITVSPNASEHQAMELMENHKLRRLLVVDDNGETYGVISQADLALEMSEEEVGEVVQNVSEPKEGGSVTRR